MERKDGNLRYREGSRALLSSNPCCTLEPDPRAAQKAPSPPHWTRAAICVGLRRQCTLCLPRAKLEREEWSCPRVATGLMPGHLRSPLTSFPETCPGSPQAPSGGSVLCTQSGAHPVSNSKPELSPKIHPDMDISLPIK